MDWTVCPFGILGSQALWECATRKDTPRSIWQLPYKELSIINLWELLTITGIIIQMLIIEPMKVSKTSAFLSYFFLLFSFQLLFNILALSVMSYTELLGKAFCNRDLFRVLFPGASRHSPLPTRITITCLAWHPRPLAVCLVPHPALSFIFFHQTFYPLQMDHFPITEHTCGPCVLFCTPSLRPVSSYLWPCRVPPPLGSS